MRRTVAIFACLALVALSSQASTFLSMGLPDLVSEADAVIQGRVMEVESFWNEAGTMILAEARVVVEEVVHGSVSPEVTILTFGGEVGHERVTAIGFPRFSPGERLLLFLGRQPDGSVRVVGYQQGQFRIVPTARGKEMAVSALDEEVRVLAPNGRLAARPKVVELSLFKDQIRAEARRNRNARQIR